LPLHLCLGNSKCFLSSILIKILYMFLCASIGAAFPIQLVLLDLMIIIFDKEYKLCSSSACSFLQPLIISCLSCPNIVLSALFSDILKLCSSLTVRDQVS
jgi:hypothetical protein